jgi:hypothetical protein
VGYFYPSDTKVLSNLDSNRLAYDGEAIIIQRISFFDLNNQYPKRKKYTRILY